ncbi:hypothetical protein ABT168_10525 [Streptomyces sp. NPDC001793]|uniref:hypothetical protein n=1 Tax=Streptomyces sp. NPDC001793 TaxID=3154657 RepID=UPI003317580C
MSGEERPERHGQAAGEATRRVWALVRSPRGRVRGVARRYERELTEPVRANGLRRLHALARGGPLILQTAVTPILLSHARVLAGRLRTGAPDALRDEGGEAACWLDEVCPDCGRPAESQGVPVCTYCHASMAC